MENQADDFTLKNYERCLILAKEKKYNFYKVSQWKESLIQKKRLVLRHDVDTQIDVALKMAEIEKSLQIKSTFYIRLHSHNYNPLCVKDLNKIRKIASLGHEIGLHYESDFYKIYSKKNKIQDCIKFEIGILENILNTKISTICPHEPTRTKQFHVPDLDICQAYDPEIFENFKYISDSSCRWRDGTLYENLNSKIDCLYVLTHPYWWYTLSPIENY